jgi:FKBP-type peptidyl-prolyl cis-trans isomerase 2
MQFFRAKTDELFSRLFNAREGVLFLNPHNRWNCIRGKRFAAYQAEMDTTPASNSNQGGTMAKARRYTVAMMVIVGCLGMSAPGRTADSAPLTDSPRVADSAPITDGSKVTLLYQITVPGDERIEVRDLSQFVQGQHQMLPALEQAVSGMRRGDKTEVKLSEDQAFGAYDAKKKTVVPTKDLPAGVKTGDVIEDRKTGQQATITQMSETDAVMDYNHPLAGKPLLVTLTILDVDTPK